VRPREEGADDLLLFGGRERMSEVCHEALALVEGRWRRAGGRRGYNGKSGVWVWLSHHSQ
jgi:hypothetical protein